jgi:hypothetical protein
MRPGSPPLRLSNSVEAPEGTRLPRAVGAEVRQIAQLARLALPGVPLATVAQALLVWAQLLGKSASNSSGDSKESSRTQRCSSSTR